MMGGEPERLRAQELADALDDPKRGEWGGYPWEHLGDAERDVRSLLAEVERLAGERDEWRRAAFNAEQGLTTARAECERLAERVAALTEALTQALDCKGAFNGTVSRLGGDPALCTKCEAVARAALADVGGPE